MSAIDYSTERGAYLLRTMIEEYWRDRGCCVAVSVHEMGFHPSIRANRYEVRSDMINGMPSSATTDGSRSDCSASLARSRARRGLPPGLLYASYPAQVGEVKCIQ